MVEKIIVNPTEVRGYGNIVNVKSDEDYEPVDCTITEDTDTVYGATVNVIVMEPDLGEATTLTVTSSSSTLVLDNTVNISATLKDSNNTAISGATITFKESGTTLGTGTTNSSGVATYTYTGSSVGSHTVVGVYDGDSTYASSTGSVGLTVNKKSTSTALTSSGSSVTVGTSVTLTATVTSGGTGVNGLTVLFKDGTSTLGTGTTNSSGVATYTTDALTEGTHSITAVVTETGTYATSTSSAVSVVVYDHSYSLAFSQASYAATGGSATLSVTLKDNNVAVSGATVSVAGSDSSLYSGITNSSGTASVTVSNISSETTFTASYSGATATCTVTVQSYLFYDDCSSSSGLSNYGSLVSLESATANANLTYDSTENAYALTSLSSSIKAFPITQLEGLDDFKLSFEFRTPSTTQKIGLGLTPMLPSTHTGIIFFVNQTSSGRESVIQIDKNHSETYWGDGQSISNYNTSNYYKLELIIDGDTATWNLYDYNNTLLRTYNYTLSNITTDYNTLSNRAYGIAVGYQNDSSAKMYIKNIKAEAL